VAVPRDVAHCPAQREAMAALGSAPALSARSAAPSATCSARVGAAPAARRPACRRARLQVAAASTAAGAQLVQSQPPSHVWQVAPGGFLCDGACGWAAGGESWLRHCHNHLPCHAGPDPPLPRLFSPARSRPCDGRHVRGGGAEVAGAGAGGLLGALCVTRARLGRTGGCCCRLRCTCLGAACPPDLAARGAADMVVCPPAGRLYRC
jgi:hypothetical protein